MDARRNAFCDEIPSGAATSAFGWARRTLRRQLDTLRRLGAAALRLVEDAMHRAAPDHAGPTTANLGALEKALRLHERVDWALRLIDALRAKLEGELERLERGEAPDPALPTEAEPSPQDLHGEKAETERGERGEYERGDYERFNLGPSFGDRAIAKILKRPPDEVIAFICRELGLSPDWPRLAEEAWEREEADKPAETQALSRSPSPWMGEGPGMGVAPYPASPQTG